MKRGEISTRRAAKADANVIAGFAMQLIEQHVGYDAARFSRIGTPEGMARYYGDRAEANEAAVLVAVEGERIIGFAYLEFEAIFYAALATNVAWLHDIFVESTERGAGAGKLLMNAVVQEARRLGANKVLLSVAAKNTLAQGFFENTGFVKTMHEMMLEIGPG